MQIHTRTIGGVVILAVSGLMNQEISGPSPLVREVSALLDRGVSNLLLHVGQVQTADSLTLSGLVHAYATTRRRGGSLKFVHVPPRLRHLMLVTKLDTVLEIFDGEEAALASFAEQT